MNNLQKRNNGNIAIHEGVKHHKCDKCDHTFSKDSNLKIHIKTIHEGVKDHKCDFCDKDFSQLHHLKTHINR